MLGSILLSSALAFGGITHAPKEHKAKEAVRAKLRKKAIVQAAAKYEQTTTNIADTKAYLEAHGSEFTEVVLCFVDDDLLQTVKDHCPNLSSFVLNSDYLLEGLTDTGLQTIGSFPLLSKLEFNCFWAVSTSDAGVLSMLQGQTNVEELSILGVNDAALSLIAEFPRLKRLTFFSYNATTAGLEAFMASGSLQQTLTALDMGVDEAAFSDTFMQNLAKYVQLTELSLSGKNSATTQNTVALLQALVNLTKLQLSGMPVHSPMVAPIGQMQNLTTLNLANCTSLGKKHKSDYKHLLLNLKNLQSLTLGRALNFTYAQVHLIDKLSLKELSLADTMLLGYGVQKLCDSATLQKSLESLMLINETSIDNEGFEPLSKLSLKTLCLQRCPLFNDTSMTGIMKGNLAANLEALELEKVSLSDATIHLLEKCPKLNTLMFVSNNAVTMDGMTTLLKLEPFFTNLKRLYLAEVTITKDMVPLFANFENIQSLLIGDAFDFNIFTDGEELFKLPNIKKNHTKVSIFLGPLTSWDSFVHW